MPDTDLPNSARIVIIGGGVGGTSIAFHLAQMGCNDVVLLERDELTNGSTFHSAGLVGQLRSSVTLTAMMMYSAELYRSLAKDPDLHPGWVQSGGIRLASTPARLEEQRRQVGWAKTFGLPLEEISIDEVLELFPLINPDGILGATYLPTDGYLDPSQLTHAFAKSARKKGVEIRTRTRVLSIETNDNKVVSVTTDQGRILADVVVDAGGMYAAEIGRMAGVRVPIVPMSHQYLVTTGFRKDHETKRLPTLRDPDLLVYFREDGEGLVMGGYERHSKAFALDDSMVDRVPQNFNGMLLPEDWERFEEITHNSIVRVPKMADLEIRKLINGPEAFTPDNEFCLGESDVEGFFVAAGFCAHGIAGAGGVGKVIAEWILEGEPSMDLWEMDVRRFGRQYRSHRYTFKKVTENYETYYDIRYPNQERQAGRPLRKSPSYEWHRKQGAVFGEKSGWERVNYYECNEDSSYDKFRPRGWAGENWSSAIVTEHLATRRSACLFDETSFSKFEIFGPGSTAFLDYMTDNNMTGRVGKVTYTQMLNSRGGIECDFTVTRLEDSRYMIVTGTAFGAHDMGWIQKHLPKDGSVFMEDTTSKYACIALWGPRSRDILSTLTSSPLDNASFPYMSAQEMSVGDTPLRALRVTYVGELGYELYCPSEYGSSLWETLIEAGKPFGLSVGGYRAIDSLRLEKGYRSWASDIDADSNPFEAGLDFCVKLDKTSGFIGAEALRKAKELGLKKRLSCIVLSDLNSVVLGNEPVRVKDQVVGRVTSGGIGYSIERSIAYAYLPDALSSPETEVEIYIFGEWVTGKVKSEPLIDPENKRVRGVYL